MGTTRRPSPIPRLVLAALTTRGYPLVSGTVSRKLRRNIQHLYSLYFFSTLFSILLISTLANVSVNEISSNKSVNVHKVIVSLFIRDNMAIHLSDCAKSIDKNKKTAMAIYVGKNHLYNLSISIYTPVYNFYK